MNYSKVKQQTRNLISYTIIKIVAYALILVATFALSSCTPAHHPCLSEDFHNTTWVAQVPAPYDNLRLQANDTIVYDRPAFGVYNLKDTYLISEDCSELYWHFISFDTTITFNIIKNTGQELWIQNGANTYQYEL